MDSLLPDNSVARSIRHGLGELDFSRFDAVYRNDLEGRPAIDPRRLTGLWILALLRGVTSSVQVARLCRTDIEFRWLCGDAHVQKSTLSAFRGDHRRPPGVSEQFDRNKFSYDASTDTMVCPVGARLKRRKLNKNRTAMTYQAKASVCLTCSHKPECSPSSSSGRSVNRPLYEDVLKRVSDRVASKAGKRHLQARSVVTEGAIGRLVSLLHWRRCCTWGGVGAQAEALWRQISHNLMLYLGHWMPLVLKPAPAGT